MTFNLDDELQQLEANEPSKQTPIVLTKFYPRPFTERIMESHRFVCEGTRGYLWVYDPNEGIWKSNGEDYIKHYFRRTIDAIDVTLMKRNVIEEIIEDIRGYCYESKGLTESDVNLIPCNNGVYNIVTGDFRGYKPDDYFTSKLPHNYNPKARCDYLKKLIDTMLPEGEIITLWELLGYLLYRGYPMQKLFILLGGGRNGKSTYTTIIHRLLGQENISGVSLADIQGNNFASASLHRKLTNISGEIDYVDIEKTNQLKQLTGGDLIQADRKYKSHIKFTNYAKLLFLTNQLPKTTDTTDAFYRRVFLITFPFQFKADSTIDMKIRSESPEMKREFEGLLYLSIQSLRQLLKQNFNFIKAQGIEEVRQLYNRLSNPVVQFLQECCDTTHDYCDFIYKFEFLNLLNSWCAERGFLTYSDVKVGKELKGMGFEDGRKPAPDSQEDKKYQSWMGIRWKNVQDTAQEDNSEQGIQGLQGKTQPFLRSMEKVANDPVNPVNPVLAGNSADRCDRCMLTVAQATLCKVAEPCPRNGDFN